MCKASAEIDRKQGRILMVVLRTTKQIDLKMQENASARVKDFKISTDPPKKEALPKIIPTCYAELPSCAKIYWNPWTCKQQHPILSTERAAVLCLTKFNQMSCTLRWLGVTYLHYSFNWLQNSLVLIGSWIHLSLSYKSSKLWSSQLWTQFKQLHLEAWKSQDFYGVS